MSKHLTKWYAEFCSAMELELKQYKKPKVIGDTSGVVRVDDVKV